jgi:putative Holliday junction resolvase
MKIAALDLGDVWTGSAISDPLGITTRPYTTVATKELSKLITKLINEEMVRTIVVGYPKTLKGTESEQTQKTKILFEHLQQTFPLVSWEWWDERFTSKQAAQLKKQKNKQDKLASHSIAAALLLMGYLAYKTQQ